jgi:hypothetical protein
MPTMLGVIAYGIDAYDIVLVVLGLSSCLLAVLYGLLETYVRQCRR